MQAGWGLSTALFESEGEPYRVVEACNPGGDGLELTFRRGWPKGIHGAAGTNVVDEKIYCDDCASIGPTHLGKVFEVTGASRVR